MLVRLKDNIVFSIELSIELSIWYSYHKKQFCSLLAESYAKLTCSFELIIWEMSSHTRYYIIV